MSSGLVDLPNAYTMGFRTLSQTYTAKFSTLANGAAVTSWFKDGQWLKIDGQVLWTGAGGAVPFVVGLPEAVAGNPQIATGVLPGGTATSNAGASMCGPLGYWFDNGAGWLFVAPKFVTVSSIGFFMNSQVLAGDQFANGDSINFRLEIPILGWS